LVNRNTVIVLAVIVVGLVAGAVFVLPLLVPPPAMSTMVEFYDDDGNLIDVPMAIMAGESEVTTMKVTASWAVEHENIQEGTFNMNGVIRIGLVDQYTLKVNSLDDFSFDSSEYVSSESHTWILTELLFNHMTATDKLQGWILEIRAVFTPTATDLEGNPVEPGATTTTPISASLSWSSQTGALNIIQCAVTRAYP